jgi:hypothetical protein
MPCYYRSKLGFVVDLKISSIVFRTCSQVGFLLMGLCVFSYLFPAYAATSLSFTVNMSEPVSVNTGGGIPRVAVDIGGLTRYASYASGTGTSALTFTYQTIAGDVDLDGVTLVSPLDLNGGQIDDLNGNSLSDLTFVLPNTSNIKVNYPSLGMDFVYDADGRYTLNGVAHNDLPSFLTATGGSFSRGGSATYYDATGALQTASANTARFDYDPVTLQFKGILIEESRTNSLRNGSGQGAIVGTPGTLPTYWQGNNLTGAGLNYQVVATGTSTGVPYTDVRIYGTPTSIFPVLYFETTSQIAAVTGQTWTISGFIQMIGGNMSGISNISLRIIERTSVGAIVVTNESAIPVSSSGSLASSRFNKVFTLYGGVTTAIAQPGIRLTVSIGTPIDITLRIGGVQLESGSFVSSFIPTTASAVTRPTDILTIPTGGWYNPNVGTMFGDVSWESSTGVNYPMMIRFDLNNLSTERWNFFFNQNIGRIGFDGYTSTVGQGSQHFGAVVTSGAAKMAAAQSLNSTNAAYAGVLGTLDTTWNPPTAVNQLTLRNLAPANKWIKNFKYYPSRVSDAQLQLMTQ